MSQKNRLNMDRWCDGYDNGKIDLLKATLHMSDDQIVVYIRECHEEWFDKDGTVIE